MAQPEAGFRSGMIAVVGRPNVGKSTLTNAMVGQKVAIVSDKPQTTRNRIMGVKSTPEYQMVFIDTPGLHKPRTRLGQYMQGAAHEAMDGMDALIVMVDASNVTERDLIIATGMAEKKSARDVHRVLVLNKIDLIEKPALLTVIAKFANLQYDDIVPVSAREGDGLAELEKTLLSRLKPGPRYFPEDMPTDQTERALCGEIIREKLLRCLRDEVPHGIGVEMMQIKENPSGVTEIHADIYCERDAHKAIIIGRNGAMLKRVGELARGDIERMLDARVYLKLFVRVRPDWRNRPADLSALGYNEKG